MVEPTKVTEQEAPAAEGWDPQLLQKLRGNRQYITSLEALQASPTYQQFVRKNYKPSRRNALVEQMKLYGDLRIVDPAGFQKVWDNPDLKSFETVEVNYYLLVLEYLFTYFLGAAAAATYLFPGPLHVNFLLCLWVLLDVNAMRQGYASYFGKWCSIYAVHGEQEFVCSFWLLLLTRFLEVVFVVGTLGLGGVCSIISRLTSVGRQGVCETILGVRLVRELEEPVSVGNYASSSPPTPVKATGTPSRLEFDNSPRFK